MIVYRAMSEKELVDFCHGITIEGRCQLQRNKNTYSLNKGVCFFLNANNACQWAGIDNIIAAFRVKEGVNFENGMGRYWDPIDDSYIYIKEIALSSYSDNQLELLGYGYAPSMFHIPSRMEFYLTFAGKKIGGVSLDSDIYNYWQED